MVGIWMLAARQECGLQKAADDQEEQDLRTCYEKSILCNQFIDT